jgi:hypothetical protein
MRTVRGGRDSLAESVIVRLLSSWQLGMKVLSVGRDVGGV